MNLDVSGSGVVRTSVVKDGSEVVAPVAGDVPIGSYGIVSSNVCFWSASVGSDLVV